MKLLKENIKLFVCPACNSELILNKNSIECTLQNHQFPIDDDIPLLFWPNDWDTSKEDVTEIVKSFYKKTPFPNYEKFENASDQYAKAQSGIF